MPYPQTTQHGLGRGRIGADYRAGAAAADELRIAGELLRHFSALAHHLGGDKHGVADQQRDAGAGKHEDRQLASERQLQEPFHDSMPACGTNDGKAAAGAEPRS